MNQQHNDLPEVYISAVKRLEKLKSTFVQNVGHELRTPITLIHGYAELLSQGALGVLAPEQQKAIFTITNQAQELRTLVERLTTLLAVEVQNTATVPPVILTHIIAELVTNHQPRTEQKELTVNVHLPSHLPPVRANSAHLRQALDCLIDNGIKFTPQGGTVDIFVEANKEWLTLTIADTGIGIPEEEQEHIFTSFYQVDGSVTRKYGGIGLGLTVAKAVIESYSGKVEVKSQPGEGSQFIIKLPVMTFPTVPTKPEFTERKPQQRILIVDDEEFVALTLKEGLEKLPNCEIAAVTNGKDALEAFAEKPFDLLFTDYKMPDMDGIALAEQIRQQYPKTIIIMITAYCNNDLHIQAAKASIQRILSKPVGFNEVRRVASEVLEDREDVVS